MYPWLTMIQNQTTDKNNRIWFVYVVFFNEDEIFDSSLFLFQKLCDTCCKKKKKRILNPINQMTFHNWGDEGWQLLFAVFISLKFLHYQYDCCAWNLLLLSIMINSSIWMRKQLLSTTIKSIDWFANLFQNYFKNIFYIATKTTKKSQQDSDTFSTAY